MDKGKILPLAAMEKLLKKCGAARVSEDAKGAMKDVLEDYGEEIGQKAVRIAQHSGRKTVKGSDIKLAVK
ncbi:histone family protein [Candidatus Woesearchaeota archaeon]|nr:histone family protein [Candidatus Woesearchaeota archaeon]